MLFAAQQRSSSLDESFISSFTQLLPQTILAFAFAIDTKGYSAPLAPCTRTRFMIQAGDWEGAWLLLPASDEEGAAAAKPLSGD